MASRHQRILFVCTLLAALATLLAPQAWSVRAAPQTQAATTKVFLPFLRKPNGNRLLVTQSVARDNYSCSQTIITNVTGTFDTPLSGDLCSTNIYEASWSPDGDYLAYSLTVNTPTPNDPALYSTTVYIATADASNPITLTSQLELHTIHIYELAWSPTSSKIAFATDSEIIIVDRPSMRISQRSPWADNVETTTADLSWSSDGKFVLVHDNARRLYYFDAVTGQRYNVSNNVNTAEWSPDAKSIAFLTSPTPIEYSLTDEQTFATYTLNDKKAHPFYRPIKSFRWASNGSAVALGGTDLSVVSPDGSAVYTARSTYPYGIYSYVWSPDSTTLGFIQSDKPGITFSDARLSNMRTILPPGDGEIIRFGGWTPGGSSLLILRQIVEGYGPDNKWLFKWTLWIASLDGSGAKPIQAKALPTSWSHDGQFFFVGPKTFIDPAIISIYRRDGSLVRSIDGTQPSWSPD